MNTFHIKTSDIEMWGQAGQLHRAIQPAVISKYIKLWFWKGIEITEKMASGTMEATEILAIENMEIRQAVLDLTGYEKFLHIAKKIDQFTPPQFRSRMKEFKVDMYELYEISLSGEENIKLLTMYDPNKFPLVRYCLRVPPAELNCKLAVAHSYDFDTWEEFAGDKIWV